MVSFPAVSIHPSRRDAMDELERCLVLGARALKLLPNCHGVDCSDRRHNAFRERMADAGLPFLLKRAAGFGDGHFTRFGEVLRQVQEKPE